MVIGSIVIALCESINKQKRRFLYDFLILNICSSPNTKLFGALSNPLPRVHKRNCVISFECRIKNVPIIDDDNVINYN